MGKSYIYIHNKFLFRVFNSQLSDLHYCPLFYILKSGGGASSNEGSSVESGGAGGATSTPGFYGAGWGHNLVPPPGGDRRLTYLPNLIGFFHIPAM
jgi:hypothetical protein